MKMRVFFYDSIDIATGKFFSLREALAEDLVIAKDDEIVPFDECSIIYEYSGKFDLSRALWDISRK